MEIDFAPPVGTQRDVQHRGGTSLPWRAGLGDFLRIELGSGRAVETVGHLSRQAEPPQDGWAFYCNDFQLTSPRPWIVPEAVRFSHQAGAAELGWRGEFSWREPELTGFADVLAEILAQTSTGQLRKAVPGVTATAAWPKDARHFLTNRAFQPRGDVGSHAYAYELTDADAAGDCRRGAVGLTPEVLFRVENGLLRTMALAGTVPSGQERELETNEKLLLEHDTVVSSLVERLAPLGDLHREARRLMPLSGMTHLCTKLSVVLDDAKWQHRVGDLINLLHPTAALGVAPRTTETLTQLQRWREHTGLPNHFGAPLGVKWPGGMLMLVAIRGIFWENDEAFLPSGCGVVEGSELQSEWAELALKRRWVRHTFGC